MIHKTLPKFPFHICDDYIVVFCQKNYLRGIVWTLYSAECKIANSEIQILGYLVEFLGDYSKDKSCKE